RRGRRTRWIRCSSPPETPGCRCRTADSAADRSPTGSGWYIPLAASSLAGSDPHLGQSGLPRVRTASPCKQVQIRHTARNVTNEHSRNRIVSMPSVTLKGNPVSLKGTELKPGDEAPPFILQNTALEDISLESSSGKTRIIA